MNLSLICTCLLHNGSRGGEERSARALQLLTDETQTRATAANKVAIERDTNGNVAVARHKGT